jgi:2-phosphoglycolate phosphatase
MKKAVRLIMFDLDGTLADTGRDLANAVNYTRTHFRLAPQAERQIYDHIGRGVEHLLKHALPEEPPDRFQEVLQVFLARYEKHLMDETVLYPGVREALAYFCDKRRVVVSNKMQRLTVKIIRSLGIEDQFDAILGGDSAKDKKPDPALIHLVLEQFQIPAASALIVGDGDTDVEAGKRAGVMTCGVTYGLSRKQDLIAAKPDVIINHLIQLADYFC